MTKLIALLTGSAGGWVLAGGLLVATLAGAGTGFWFKGVLDAPGIERLHTAIAESQRATQQCIATSEKGRADSNQKAVDALTAAGIALQTELATLAAADAARKAHDAKFTQELANAPHTTICGTSPAERAYRDSVRPAGAPGSP